MYREKTDQDRRQADQPKLPQRQPKARLASAIARILGGSRARKAENKLPPGKAQPGEPDIEWMMRLMG